MRKFLVTCWVSVCLLGFGPWLMADQEKIRNSVRGALPGVEIDSIERSEIDGLYEVSVGPQLFYVSSDGRYLIQGKMIDLKFKKDLTEAKIAKARLAALRTVGSDKMIVFKSDNAKHVVSVFTDIDCGYCRKLHSEMDQYLDRGISIQYLFFPRAGDGSDSYKKAVSVWCADDRHKALTSAKKGASIKSKTCENPVREHMALAAAMGAKGTPMIVSEDGSVLPGYVPAEQLTKVLDAAN